jgi:hypothetical protein
MSDIKKLIKDYISESLNDLTESANKVPGTGSSTQDVGAYLDHDKRGHHDGSDGVSHYYVVYKPKTVINSLKKAGWQHKPAARYDKPDEYIHPDGHTTIKHLSGSTNFNVKYKRVKITKRN